MNNCWIVLACCWLKSIKHEFEEIKHEWNKNKFDLSLLICEIKWNGRSLLSAVGGPKTYNQIFRN